MNSDSDGTWVWLTWEECADLAGRRRERERAGTPDEDEETAP